MTPDNKSLERCRRALLDLRALLSLALVVLAFACSPHRVQAQGVTLWNGPLLGFNESAGADPTLAANQDRLTPDVWLTRASSAGLFNAAAENAYARFTSPAGTEWAYGTLDNYASLTFGTWAAMSGNNPPSMVGKSAVLHLIPDNIYLSVTFTSWGGIGGGFSYERSTPNVPEPSTRALLFLIVGLYFSSGQFVAKLRGAPYERRE